MNDRATIQQRRKKIATMSSFEMQRVIPKDFIIETARCRLRLPSEADIPQVFSATRYAGFNDGMQWEPPDSIDELSASLADHLLAWEVGQIFTFTIADPASDRLIGRIGIRTTNRRDVWNLGFWTHPEHQGRGYMTESVRAMMAFGFQELGAVQIEASYALWNKASKRVLEKVGMRSISYIPHSFQKKGRWVETYRTRISKQEWLALNLE